MKKTLCASYDLSKPRRNYEDLIAALKSYSGWWHNLESTWFISTPKSPSEVRGELTQFIDNDDKLLVFAASAPGLARASLMMRTRGSEIISRPLISLAILTGRA